MTRTQRQILETIIKRAERGPCFSPNEHMTGEEAARQARIWSQSWVEDPLRLLLDNVDGKVAAHQLRDWTH
jgi:hypothetical protein